MRREILTSHAALFSRGQPSRTRVPPFLRHALFPRRVSLLSSDPVSSGNACPGRMPMSASIIGRTYLVTKASQNCTSVCLVLSRLLPRAIDRSLLRLLPHAWAEAMPIRRIAFASLPAASRWRDFEASFGGSSTAIVATFGLARSR
jgi:hypothetical protein